MPTLQDQIQSFAETFATSVMHALRSASLDEILAQAGGKVKVARGRGAEAVATTDAAQTRAPRKSDGRRLPRRNEEDITRIAEQIVAFVAKHPDGVRAEGIRAGLGLRQNEWPRPLAAALSGKRLRKKGEKRATTYFVK